MTYPLVVLAGLAVIASVFGVPESLGGGNRFEQWLEPVFAHGHAAAAEHVSTTEYVLMLASVGVALLGIFLARAMYLTKTLSPDRVAEVAGGKLYDLVYNKYYIDEIYGAVFVNGLLWLTRLSAAFDSYIIDGIVNAAASLVRGVSWLNGLFDKYIIDGAVNAVAALTLEVGTGFRRLQTGSINGYLYAVVAGVLVVMIVRLAWAG